MGVRQSRKQATHERVLAAARDLFQEIGYEETTIRMVAQRAGVSVGSVFTTFASKAHILSQIMDDRLDGLYAELDQVVPHLRGPAVDRLRSVMAVHYSFETRRLRLFVAYIGESYNWSLSEDVIPIGRNQRLRAILREIVEGGIARGEVRAEVDPECFIDVLLAAYVWNYRRAPRQNADADALIVHMDRQIGLLFEGVAARPAP